MYKLSQTPGQTSEARVENAHNTQTQNAALKPPEAWLTECTQSNGSQNISFWFIIFRWKQEATHSVDSTPPTWCNNEMFLGKPNSILRNINRAGGKQQTGGLFQLGRESPSKPNLYCINGTYYSHKYNWRKWWTSTGWRRISVEYTSLYWLSSWRLPLGPNEGAPCWRREWRVDNETGQGNLSRSCQGY